MIFRSSSASRMSDKSVGSSEPISFLAPYLMSARFFACLLQEVGCCRAPHIKLFSDPNNSALLCSSSLFPAVQG